MTGPGEPEAIMAAVCYTCLRTAWRGNVLPEGKDGQDLLTEFAGPDGQPCPGNSDECPHKPTAREKARRKRAATLAELDELKGRITALEARNPRP